MKIAVMGYGTIGSGVVDVLRINKEKITKRAGEPVDVKYILDLREFPGDPMEDAIVHDYQTIVNDPEIGIVVETMGRRGACIYVCKRQCLRLESRLPLPIKTWLQPRERN